MLVGGANMPRTEVLPEPVRQLARKNAVSLRPERFRSDCQGLITELKAQLAAVEAERAARQIAARATVDASRAAEDNSKGSIEVALKEAFFGKVINLDGGLVVTVPAGAHDGLTVFSYGTLDNGRRSTGPQYKLKITKHGIFQVDGVDLFSKLEVDDNLAKNGGLVNIETISGKTIKVKIPKQKLGGQIRLAGQGMPVLGTSDHGDWYIQIEAGDKIKFRFLE